MVDAAVFVFVWISVSTYVTRATRKLGVGMLVIQIVCLITFYGVVFGPQEIGWNAAASFDGSAIAFGVIVLFDNWLWPDPGEPILMESLGASVACPFASFSGLRTFFSLAKAYLDRHCQHRLPTYPHIWRFLIKRWPRARPSIAGRSCLLRSRARLASVLKWILITTARENLPQEIRTMVPGEIQRAVNAIAAALDEISQKLPARIVVGADERAPATRTHVRLAMDNLAARVIQIRPAYIGKTSPAEIENFAEFIDSLAVLTRHIERPLDEPPGPPTTDPSNSAVPRTALERSCRSRGCALLLESRLVHGGRLSNRPHFPASGLIHDPGDRNNNRDIHLWRNPAQDVPPDHRSYNRRSGFPSRYHYSYA